MHVSQEEIAARLGGEVTGPPAAERHCVCTEVWPKGGSHRHGPWVFAAGVVLVLHGMIHLMGTTVYMKLGHVEASPYKTTLLGGRWDPGEGGMRVFGALWLIPADHRQGVVL
jgi:hypothetical protein